jgi:hypothetical protein
MEVHAHSHTARKKWHHYLWEFLMLFLAVTLGFFVENQREHLVEHQREKQYMQNLIQDLSRDTTDLQQQIAWRQKLVRYADSLVDLINSPQKDQHLNDIYFYGRALTILQGFNYSDATMRQLKNSGALRLIKHQFIVDSIVAYDQSAEITGLREQTILVVQSDMRNSIGNVLDATVMKTMIDTNYLGQSLVKATGIGRFLKRPEKAKPLITEDKKTINQFCTSANYLYALSFADRQNMITQKARAMRLIVLLKREYHLK